MQLKSIILSLTLLSLPLILTGQSKTEEFSDPAAKKILDEMRSRLKAFEAFEATFTLVYEIPGQDHVKQQGKAIQQEAMYRLEMDGVEMVSDGATRWLYQEEINEVQLYSAKTDGESFETPLDFLKVADSGDYIYAISGQEVNDGITHMLIEFKPKDASNEYSKMRLSVNEKNKLPSSLTAFARDGSRTIITLKKLVEVPTKQKEYFQFDRSKYPGIHVEDLRID